MGFTYRKAKFSGELRICIGQGDDAGTFVWCRSNEIYENDCLKKTCKISIVIDDKGLRAVVTSSKNAQVYIEILEAYSNNWKDVFQEDNSSCHRAKHVKTFLQERHVMSLAWPANSPDLKPVETLWWKLKKMVHDKAPTCKADLVSAIRERWSQSDEEYCLSISPCLREFKLF